MFKETSKVQKPYVMFGIDCMGIHADFSINFVSNLRKRDSHLPKIMKKIKRIE
jgi:hypothetical protein